MAPILSLHPGAWTTYNLVPMKLPHSSALAALIATVLVPSGLSAQKPPRKDTAISQARPTTGVKVEPSLRFEGEYDSNVFLLSPARRRDLEAPTSADISSGRFNGMQSPADFIVRARAGVGVELDGVGGRTIALFPALQFDHYTRNDARSHMTALLSVAQDFAHGMRTRLEAAYIPSFFTKSYLIDAVDADRDGKISRNERRYERASHSVIDLEIAHRLRLHKNTRRSPFGADLDVAAGYYARSFDAPFSNHDLSGPTLRAELGISSGSRAEFTIGYDGEMLSAPAGQEVLILDESDAGLDLNGNGRANDVDVRTVQNVDRSRREQELTLGARFDLSPRTNLQIGYGVRLRAFSSDQPLDLGHRNRRDTRHDLGAEMSTRIAHGVRLNAGARFARQTSNRLVAQDESDESDDYARVRAFAGFRVEF